MVNLFVMIFIALVLFVCICFIIGYMTHIKMNRGTDLPYDFVHFDTFQKIFDKYKYCPTLKYDKNYNSIFLRNEEKDIVYLHASIVKFNNQCMIFYPISWVKYLLWINKNFKPENNRVKNLWIQKRQ